METRGVIALFLSIKSIKINDNYTFKGKFRTANKSSFLVLIHRLNDLPRLKTVQTSEVDYARSKWKDRTLVGI